MIDGALLLVDATEGPLPQTRFVVKKALEKKLPMLLVINKIDRKDARIKEVLDEIYELFIEVDANDEQINFPILYTNAKLGVAHKELDDESNDLKPLFEAILKEIPAPDSDDNKTPQLLVTNLDYDPYVGQISIGRLENGTLEMNKNYSLCREDKIYENVKFSALYSYEGLSKKQVDKVYSGDIIAVAGVENVKIGDTISSAENPQPIKKI